MNENFYNSHLLLCIPRQLVKKEFQKHWVSRKKVPKTPMATKKVGGVVRVGLYFWKGWPPNRTRDMSVYVRPKQPTILMDFDDCRGTSSDSNSSYSLKGGRSGLWKAKTKLLVMQHTFPSHFKVRMDNRRTWMHFTKVLRRNLRHNLTTFSLTIYLVSRYPTPPTTTIVYAIMLPKTTT